MLESRWVFFCFWGLPVVWAIGPPTGYRRFVAPDLMEGAKNPSSSGFLEGTKRG